MKAAKTIFESGDHRWVAIARDPNRPSLIIDTVEYIVVKGDRAALLDPGGIEVFPAMFNAVAGQVEARNIEFLFSSHQDPDVISSLPLWLALNRDIKCYVSWLWGTFLPHFGTEKDTLVSIPDEGMEVTLNKTLKLQFVPAHYLHSSGNFHVYDPQAKVLFSGDVGAALLPDAAHADIFVTNFNDHIKHMQGFHTRWMGSNEAKNNWADRVSRLKIDFLCPQHGSIFQGEDVARFLEWFRGLKVGEAAVKANRGMA